MSVRHLLGPKPSHEKEIRVLTRVIAWGESGITYESDQRHSELVVRELGLEDAKAVGTPHTNDETKAVTEAESPL